MSVSGEYQIPLPWDVLHAATIGHRGCLYGYAPGFVEFEETMEGPEVRVFKLMQEQLGDIGEFRLRKLGDKLTALEVHSVRGKEKEAHLEKVLAAYFNRLVHESIWQANNAQPPAWMTGRPKVQPARFDEKIPRSFDIVDGAIRVCLFNLGFNQRVQVNSALVNFILRHSLIGDIGFITLRALSEKLSIVSISDPPYPTQDDALFYINQKNIDDAEGQKEKFEAISLHTSTQMIGARKMADILPSGFKQIWDTATNSTIDWLYQQRQTYHQFVKDKVKAAIDELLDEQVVQSAAEQINTLPGILKMTTLGDLTRNQTGKTISSETQQILRDPELTAQIVERERRLEQDRTPIIPLIGLAQVQAGGPAAESGLAQLQVSRRRYAPSRKADYDKWVAVWRKIKPWIDQYGMQADRITDELKKSSRRGDYKGPTFTVETIKKIIAAGKAGELKTS
jgi:hypothetical protein